jgi:hypothetical protein
MSDQTSDQTSGPTSGPTSSPGGDATKEYPVTDLTTPLPDEPATTTATATGPAGSTEPSPSVEPLEPVELGAPTPVRRGPSVPTIVWGLLFALIAAVVMIGQTSEADLNLEVSVPVTLLVAGVVLVVWGVAGLGRSRRTP